MTLEYSIAFLFKKMIGPFFFPLSICTAFFMCGLVFLWFTRKQKTGKIFISIGFSAMILFSYGILDNILLKPLEYKYKPLNNIYPEENVKWIVVLGGGTTPDPRIPPSAQLSRPSLARLVEGIRIHNHFPESKLVLSGGNAFGSLPAANVMADAAVALGVKKMKLVLDADSKDTEDQAKLLSRIVGDDPFILVTSACHMPRSMMYFERHGMRPTPSPTDYYIKTDKKTSIHPGVLFPGLAGFEKAQRAIYEYLGIAWAKLLKKV